jgi:hypothetical protein
MSRREIKTVDWNSLLAQKEFWLAYFDADAPEQGAFEELYFDIENDTEYTLSDLILPFPDGFSLMFSSYEAPIFMDVFVQEMSKTPGPLGHHYTVKEWFDALRVEETQAILQCLKNQSSDKLPIDFKYIPLLLRKFTVPNGTNNEMLFEKTIEFAYNTGIFSRLEGEEIARKFHYFEGFTTWHYNEKRGWALRNYDGYHFRKYAFCPPHIDEEEYEEYNFVLVRDFMRTVHKCAGIENVLV